MHQEKGTSQVDGSTTSRKATWFGGPIVCPKKDLARAEVAFLPFMYKPQAALVANTVAAKRPFKRNETGSWAILVALWQATCWRSESSKVPPEAWRETPKTWRQFFGGKPALRRSARIREVRPQNWDLLFWVLSLPNCSKLLHSWVQEMSWSTESHIVDRSSM